jgi:hypothetical protein
MVEFYLSSYDSFRVYIEEPAAVSPSAGGLESIVADTRRQEHGNSSGGE